MLTILQNGGKIALESGGEMVFGVVREARGDDMVLDSVARGENLGNDVGDALAFLAGGSNGLIDTLGDGILEVRLNGDVAIIDHGYKNGRRDLILAHVAVLRGGTMTPKWPERRLNPGFYKVRNWGVPLVSRMAVLAADSRSK